MKVKVASFNIHNGMDVQYDFSVLAKDITDTGLDVVGLQEIDRFVKRSKYQDTVECLKACTGMQYTAYAPALEYTAEGRFRDYGYEKGTVPPEGSGQYGVAVLSKYPILNADYLHLPKTTEKEEQRAVLYTQIDINGTVLNFFTTHADGGSIAEQLTVIEKWASKLGHYVVTGDFNCQDFALFYEKFPGQTLAMNAENGLKTVGNSRTIDNIVISADFALIESSVNCTGHSDHHMPVAVIDF